ncbi:MAG: type I glyceraldehyde-3-phosphate dehydrogenase [Bacteroidetes bacterium]|nr:type I glyceraldehyde-3-phosphate dehydrogenase [Bacteroidota bacterium]MBI3483290.1 type I glyceraldehyde-3-phosphate dehydrogenase [Bacteroidota bacterium]
MENLSARLAINGMGRIGRTLVRLLHQKGLIKNLIAVNDIMSKENLIYLLKYDSIRGTFPCEIIPTPNGFSIDDHEIFYLQQNEIKNLPWKNFSIDAIIEATGLFTHSSEASHHLTSGAKRVLLTTFSKDIPTKVIGVNQAQIKEALIISPGDCTINCVAPIIHLMKENFGVDSVHVNVIQGYTTRQELIDKPYKGLRRGRAAAHSIIPFEVNIKPVLENIFPELQDKIESMSTRVPVPCGAIAGISLVLKKSVNTQTINSLIEKGSRAELKNIIDITYDPIVSTDILNNSHSSTIDGQLTKVTSQHLRLMAWFDNEWGYANRLLDWLVFLNK